ncbi:sensor of ECF-type sigma factor [Maribellus comscasis]|uniref:Sensor of ECF-type sigma factor n=1 Tax=Maribellus comscasis TaxID=2681766 RepID=A0A6I6JR02_9BACT|nr:sensor of ECF-type sigma factor [Maribellus comscasis]QGY45435.1 sensor of ECF-type sigma factor [Maribellus comscasis]
MKNKFLLVVLFIFIFGSFLSHAQDKKDGESRWEKFRAEKVSFLTEKLELTPTEAQKFWPVYNELEKSRWEAQKARRELEAKVHDVEDKNLSKKEIIQLTRDFSSSMEKEGLLYVKYNEEFLKILPPEKVLILYRSENEFRMHMIRKYRDRDKKDDK